MSYWQDQSAPLRRELHFGDRIVRCFSERPVSVDAMLREAARRFPERDALICETPFCETRFREKQRYSWRELDAIVERCATGLFHRGIGKGERVALLLGNCNEFVIAFLAALRLGAIAVPLNIRQQTDELDYALNQCGATLLVHEADLAQRLPAAARVPALRHRVAVGDGADSESFAALLDDGAAGELAPVNIAEEDTAAILYTSGTTGKPKGAMLSHLGIVHSALHYQASFELTEQDRCVAAVPLSHVTGLVAMVAAMLRSAGALIIMPAFKAADFLALAARERMTYTLIVPAMYNLCLLQADFDSHDLSAWRIGGYGGAPMPPAAIARFAQKLPGLQLMNVYGATETTSPVTIMPARYTAALGDSVGQIAACAEVAIMDEHGREVAPGESGELWIKGPMVVRGYWDNPQASAAALTAGYWRSGDIGAIDADGFVRVFDRKKDMINRAGFKIYTAEVEAVLAEHAEVAESAVIAKPCPVLGERVHAVVVTRSAALSADELRQFCAQRLSDYKVPETYTLRAEPLPRNANGKVLKRDLRDALIAESGAG